MEKPEQPATQHCNIKETCYKLLTKLLQLSLKTSKAAQESVRSLIQDLINTKIGVEEFCSGIGALLNTTFHKNVFDALKSGLLPLRLALFNREITIEGINPPVNFAWGLTLQQNAVKDVRVLRATTAQIVYLNPKTKIEAIEDNTKSPSLLIRKTIKTMESMEIDKATILRGAAKTTLPTCTATVTTNTITAATPTNPTAADDVNDVLAMSGVDLEQESKVAAERNFKYQTCPPENSFLHLQVLQARLRSKMLERGLEGQQAGVVELISCACKEFIKDAIEKLVVITEHRTDSLKNDARYEVFKDVRGQLNFLEELDKAEQKRQKEVEREVLLRAAKLKTKHEDPEQMRMKDKAKEMQRVEMEEMRQRDANMTVLQAIGPRKKLKIDGDGQCGITVPQPQIRTRIKRITRQDMLFFMEQDPKLFRSQLLCEAYLKKM